MQIDRQAQSPLHQSGESQISGATPVHHQGIAHARCGAVQINGHRTGMLPISAVLPKKFAGTLELQSRGFRLQRVRKEAAVEIAIDVTATTTKGLWVADHPLHRQPSRIDQRRIGLPLLHQPGRIDLISMGAGHHQNATAGHGHQRTVLTEA